MKTEDVIKSKVQVDEWRDRKVYDLVICSGLYWRNMEFIDRNHIGSFEHRLIDPWVNITLDNFRLEELEKFAEEYLTLENLKK